MSLEKVTKNNYGLPRNEPRFPVYSYWFNKIVDYLNTYLPSGLGSTITPIVRTNNPTLAANLPNDNIAALDAAIGVTPTSTTVIATAASVNTNLSALDTYIAALPSLTTLSIKTVKKNVGHRFIQPLHSR